ncbi:MAG TPA: sigma-70 family RNA polymerase sigma factor [Bacillota bacterium]|jgi:RNA polymerase sigma-70 factor (ECF subfamily)
MTGSAANAEGWPIDPREAVERLMAEYGSVVLKTAVFATGDRKLAEDVSQEVFVRAFKSWPNFRRESSAKTWLTRITLNVGRDLSASRVRERPTDPALLATAQARGPDQVAGRLDHMGVLPHLMALPAAYRQALFLHYYLDLDTKEIARATRVAEGTARARLHRGRRRLRESLLKGGWNGEATR